MTPFVTSTKTTFQTMFQLDIEIGEPSIKAPDAHSYDVSAIIGFSGDLEGSIVLTFTDSAAINIAQIMTGEDLTDKPEDLTDAVGEIVNMVAGGAKAKFDGKSVAITCPNVVVGKSHRVSSQTGVPCICVPCVCDCGEFMMEIAVRDSSGANTQSAAATSNA